MTLDDSRRTLLRYLGLGAAGAITGGTGGAILARYPGVRAKAIDVEQIRATVMAADSFELETAWLHETPDRTRTIPNQPADEFPLAFDLHAGPALHFEDIEPGTKGRLLAAYTIDGTTGRVRCAGLQEGSSALAEILDVTCWQGRNRDGADGGKEQLVFEGPLATFPSEPFGSPRCIEPGTVGEFELAYQVPEIEDDDVLERIEGQSLDFAFQLVAEQC